MIKLLHLCFLSIAIYTPLSFAETYDISQTKKQFSQESIIIKVGDKIDFPNNDPFFHNVYSLSPAKSFELGSYPPGVSRGIVFDEVGEVDVRCAIHSNMQLTVTVEPK